MLLVAGYVLQDDVLPGTSTVFECISFHAQLRMPGSTSESAMKKQVQLVCSQLGLQKVMHSFIGDSFVRGISGAHRQNSLLETLSINLRHDFSSFLFLLIFQLDLITLFSIGV